MKNVRQSGYKPSLTVFYRLKLPVRLCGLAGAAFLLMHQLVRADVQPYIADGSTLHLWHLDEAGAPALDFVGNNPKALQGLLNNATLGSASHSGFGTALNTHTNSGGTAGNATFKGGLLLARPALADGSGDNVAAPFSYFGPDGAFTLEAIVKLNVLPNNAPGTALEIISMDDEDSSASRVFQFRIERTPTPTLNFAPLPNSGASGGGFATLPTTGPHAVTSGVWYHVAVTYDGNANVVGNLKCYWTRLDSGVQTANPFASLTLSSDLSGNLGDFAIGNEARGFSGNAEAEPFPGLIDEVRISSVARGSNEFVFRGVSILEATGTQSPNVPENTLDGNLATRWTAQGDGQYITYDLGRSELVESIDLAFYQPGSVRSNYFDVLVSNDNVAWRPALTNGSGTNASLANFDLPDWPARYVRIVGHLNSQNDFNSLTEVVIHRSLLADADSDGLPDFWENYYFSDLDETAAGDPDGDLRSNAVEYEHDTDPTVYNAPGDSDGDSLPDVWEQLWFGNLNQNATGDPDGDGSNNLAEYGGGSDPTDARSIPGDTDGDSQPDDWELANLDGLAYGPYDDPDGDNYSNVAERLGVTDPLDAASHPSWKSPGVSLLRDSVVASDACLMPSSATYGRAINGISFQDQILVTFGGYQYTAWYDTVGTVQKVWLARRPVVGAGAGAWEKFQTDSEFLNGDETAWDAHNVIAFGICPGDGTLHVMWDLHGHTMRYRRSVVGLCTTNKAAWGAGMLGAEQNWLVAAGQTETSMTYPQFTPTPTGGLMMNRRFGASGSGDQYFQVYNPVTGWVAGKQFINRTGTYGSSTARNAYLNGFDYGPDGKLHASWTWREGAGTSNHDLCYAYSTDNGVTWRNNVGTVIADTGAGGYMTLNSPGIVIKPFDANQLLINQQAQCVDNEGRVHVLMLHRREDSGYEYPNYTTATYSTLATAYYHYFRDPATGVWTQRRIPPDAYPVGSRPKIGYDANGNVYAAYISYTAGTAVTPGYTSGKLVIASASKTSQYTDWEVVQTNNLAFDGEPLIDQARLLSDNVLSVYIQEHSATTSVVGTSLHVFDFAVGSIIPLNIAERVYALTIDNQLISFDSTTPGNILSAYTVSGLQANEKIVGLDFWNGTLYGLGDLNHLYTINRANGAAGLVGSFSPAMNGEAFGFDAEPAGLRLVSNLDQNLLLAYADGAATTGATLNGSPNPAVTGLAYHPGNGQRYVADYSQNTIGMLSPASGQVTTIGLAGIDFSRHNGFDISSNPGNTAYLASPAASSDPAANLYKVDLTTGAATLVGLVGLPGDDTLIRGLAVGPGYVELTPTNLTFNPTGNQLALFWPSDHTGWRLQVQTNSISTGLSTNWFEVLGSTSTNSVLLPVDVNNGSVFYRLIYP